MYLETLVLHHMLHADFLQKKKKQRRLGLAKEILKLRDQKMFKMSSVVQEYLEHPKSLWVPLGMVTSFLGKILIIPARH